MRMKKYIFSSLKKSSCFINIISVGIDAAPGAGQILVGKDVSSANVASHKPP
jgi:hypothetical protein